MKIEDNFPFQFNTPRHVKNNILQQKFSQECFLRINHKLKGERECF